MNIGFVGTGTMGNPMARCPIDAGHRVTVHDLPRESTTNLCELGAHWANSPRAVAEASEEWKTPSALAPAMVSTVICPSAAG